MNQTTIKHKARSDSLPSSSDGNTACNPRRLPVLVTTQILPAKAKEFLRDEAMRRRTLTLLEINPMALGNETTRNYSLETDVRKTKIRSYRVVNELDSKAVARMLRLAPNTYRLHYSNILSILLTAVQVPDLVPHSLIIIFPDVHELTFFEKLLKKLNVRYRTLQKPADLVNTAPVVIVLAVDFIYLVAVNPQYIEKSTVFVLHDHLLGPVMQTITSLSYLTRARWILVSGSTHRPTDNAYDTIIRGGVEPRLPSLDPKTWKAESTKYYDLFHTISDRKTMIIAGTVVSCLQMRNQLRAFRLPNLHIITHAGGPVDGLSSITDIYSAASFVLIIDAYPERFIGLQFDIIYDVGYQTLTDFVDPINLIRVALTEQDIAFRRSITSYYYKYDAPDVQSVRSTDACVMYYAAFMFLCNVRLCDERFVRFAFLHRYSRTVLYYALINWLPLPIYFRYIDDTGHAYDNFSLPLSHLSQHTVLLDSNASPVDVTSWSVLPDPDQYVIGYSHSARIPCPSALRQYILVQLFVNMAATYHDRSATPSPEMCGPLTGTDIIQRFATGNTNPSVWTLNTNQSLVRRVAVRRIRDLLDAPPPDYKHVKTVMAFDSIDVARECVCDYSDALPIRSVEAFRCMIPVCQCGVTTKLTTACNAGDITLVYKFVRRYNLDPVAVETTDLSPLTLTRLVHAIVRVWNALVSYGSLANARLGPFVCLRLSLLVAPVGTIDRHIAAASLFVIFRSRLFANVFVKQIQF